MGNSGCSRKASFNIYLRKLISREKGRQQFIADTLLVLKMAAVHATTSTILSFFLPQFSTSAASFASRTTSLKMRQLALPLLPSLSLSLPAAIQLKIPTLLGDLWESLLRAVPKKKTSYMKKRSRFMAGKALKDVTALNRCSACGHVKRAHILCPYCVKGKPYLINNSETVLTPTVIEIQSLFRSSIMYSLNKKSKPAPSSGAS
jgi:large subunit ribosomal protein L32